MLSARPASAASGLVEDYRVYPNPPKVGQKNGRRPIKKKGFILHSLGVLVGILKHEFLKALFYILLGSR